MIYDDFESVDLRSHVETGDASVIDLEPPRHDPFKAPELFVGDVGKALLQNYFSQSLVLGASVYRVTGASVTAEGMIVTNGHVNTSLNLNVDKDYISHYHRGTLSRLSHLRVVDIQEPVVLLTGPGHLVYGHWLVDFLPKLYLLHRCGYRLNRLRFLIPADTPRFALDWLALLSVHENQMIFYDRLSDIVRCRELIVPSSLRFSSRASFLFTEACDFLKKTIARTIPYRRADSRSKIYLARSSNGMTHNHRVLVERDLMTDKARRRGFHVIRPESLSAAEQFSLFSNVDILVGEYGSALHNAMFAPSYCVVLAARDDSLGLGFLQSGIGERVGHLNGYLIGAAQTGLPGAFSIDVDTIDLGFEWLSWTLSSQFRGSSR